MLTVAYGEATMDRSNVYGWYKMFSEGRKDVNDEERAGRTSTSTTDEKINEVGKMILANRRITVREVAEDLNITIGSCHSIFINDLGMRRVAANFVPKLLNCDQKQHRMNIANEMLDSVRDDPNLLQRVITDQAPMDDLKLLIINLSAEVNRLGEKMDARLLNIEQKMEVWERRMAGIETSMASCTDALATNTRLISHNTLKIRNLEERAEALERRARENNLIIYGIESAETDSRELLLQKVKKLMAEDMQITDDVVIAECHRLGRGPKAPILIEVPDHESRISLLKNSFKLRMLNTFMSRDYSPQIREQRKILIEKRKELYKKGIGSKLRDNKLLLNGINYMVVEGQVMNAKGELI
ncbi:hypothetical protein LAZ67_14001565 [Cordylochernes scorpioides]|uniref:Uncharacterized protein n=1 Tax=Cordylochernes scorpioides TaxID=51811 RepID=A0ABY6L681_9ARAC|nr:hypothetical protein LAZ67_14001565 [Cordylochernes scorpioides]